MIVKSQQNRTELVTRPGREEDDVGGPVPEDNPREAPVVLGEAVLKPDLTEGVGRVPELGIILGVLQDDLHPLERS